MCASTAKAALSVRRTVLVVDPQHRVEQMLNRLVLAEGWNLCEAPDNEAVLALMKASSFDLVITGQSTSTQQDLELLQRIRGIRPHVRMIIVTDTRTPGDVIASLRQRVFSFFTAPFSGEYFAHMVRLAMIEPCWDDGIEVISATPKWIRLSVRCTRDAASRLIQFVRQAANVPDAEREEVACAIQEIVLNAMEHGGHFDPNQYVEVSYVRTKRAIACRVKDPGKGFTLEELRDATLNNPLAEIIGHMGLHEESGTGGRFGILLAMKLVDEIIYGEHGNDVVLIKHLDSPAAAPSLPGKPPDAGRVS